MSSADTIETLLSTNEIPIIDLGITDLRQQPSRSDIERLAGQLDDIFRDKGIAFFVNHGLSEQKLNRASQIFEQFCSLDDTVKDVFKRKGNHDNHGYVKPGQERFDKNVKEIRHAFNVGNLSARNYPTQDIMADFHEIVTDLVKDYNALETIVLKALSLALGQTVDFFGQRHQQLSVDSLNGTTLRLLYYPPVPKDAEGNGDAPLTRCGAHCDYGTFTLLSQDSEGGLEVQLPGTTIWKRVGHLPGALLLNGGEMLTIWSDFKYVAAPHRVIIPEDGDLRNVGRHSRALFSHAYNDSIIVPLNRQASMAPEQLITAGQLLERKFMQTY